MQKVDTFILKDGQVMEIVWPSMQLLKGITEFVNRLSKEDTFLSFAGETYSLGFEKNWLNNVIREIKFGKSCVFWATIDNKVVGLVDIKQNGPRSKHVGTIGLMVDQDYRALGLGKHLLKLILDQAKKSGYKIADLNVFDDNVIAIKLYEKFGFQQWGKLPKALFRQGKYSDRIHMYKNLDSDDQ